jgi:hypothetical protein
MKRGIGRPWRNCDRRIAIASAALLSFAVLAGADFVPKALAQNPPPAGPTSDPFKAMNSPNGPADLATPPSSSLITPSLLSPATGPVTPPAGFNGGKIVMKQTVWQDYLRYLHQDVATGFGLFMITVDGQASDVKQCTDFACQISPLSQSTAMTDCQGRRNNRRCIIFAEGRSIKYAYQVVP